MPDNSVDIKLGIGGAGAVIAQLRGVQGALDGIGKVAGLISGAIIGLEAAFAGLIIKSIRLSDETGKAAAKAGAGVEKFSALAKEAALADISISELSDALRFFQREMVKQGRGNEDVVNTFVATVQAMSKMEDQAQLTALQVEFFGRSGTKLNEFISESPDLIDRMNKSLEEGSVVTKEGATLADLFGDNLTKFGQRIQSVGVQVAAELLPKLVELTEKLLDFERQTGFIEGAIKGLLAILISLVQGFRVLAVIVVNLTSVISSAVDNGWRQFIEVLDIGRTAVNSLINSLKQLATVQTTVWSAIARAARGDFKGAMIEAQLAVEKLKGGVIGQAAAVTTFLGDAGKSVTDGNKRFIDDAVKAWQDGTNEIGEIASQTQELIDGLFPEGGGASASAPNETPSGGTPLGPPGTGAGTKDWFTTVLEERLNAYEEFFAKVGRMGKDTVNNLGSSLINFSADLMNSISTGVGNAFAAVATGAAKASEAFKALGKQMLGMLVSYFTQLILNTILFNTVASALRRVAFASAFTQAAALTAINSAGAVAANISSFGAASAFGPIATAQILGGFAMGQSLGAAGLAGAAHGGMDSIPVEGSFLMSAGERVVQPDANERLTDFLSDWESGGSRVGNVYVDGQKAGQIIWEMTKNGQAKIAGKAVVT